MRTELLTEILDAEYSMVGLRVQLGGPAEVCLMGESSFLRIELADVTGMAALPPAVLSTGYVGINSLSGWVSRAGPRWRARPTGPGIPGTTDPRAPLSEIVLTLGFSPTDPSCWIAGSLQRINWWSGHGVAVVVDDLISDLVQFANSQEGSGIEGLRRFLSDEKLAIGPTIARELGEPSAVLDLEDVASHLTR